MNDLITLYNTLRMAKAVHADTTEIEAEIKRCEERLRTQTLDEFLKELDEVIDKHLDLPGVDASYISRTALDKIITEYCE